MSKKHLVMVLTEPTHGQEDEYNDYYDHTHLDEVIATTRLVSAQRYKLAGEAGEGCPLPYLAIYEAEGDNADDILANMHATRAERQQSAALNMGTGRIWVFEELGPKHT
ncbi:MAG: hypothetical protein AAF513_08700 [Pseudomonadota bacterium]